MSKVYFFYTNGTAQADIFGLLDMVNLVFQNLTLPKVEKKKATIAGLDGRTALWDGAPSNDPFPSLLDPNIFIARKVAYPAAAVPIKLSMDVGVTNVSNGIRAMPKGSKFMIGGYSQGAAVASEVMLQITQPGGALEEFASQFLGGICFGNPRRALDYRGSVGGTWSGYWDDPTNLLTTGGHGSFPTDGPYARLTPAQCDPLKWIEFNEIDDIFSSTGDTEIGVSFQGANDVVINLMNLIEVFAHLDNAPQYLQAWQAAEAVGNTVNNFTDAAGEPFEFPGAGHTAYAFQPPPGDPANGMTSYQIALQFLTDRAVESATAPIILPHTPTSQSTAGWSTVLLPPAS